MPMRGGAIQLAYLPGSTHGFINEEMNVMSLSFGNHCPDCSCHFASEIISPAGLDALAFELSNAAIKCFVGLRHFEVDTRLFNDLIPAINATLAVSDVVIQQSAIDATQCWDVLHHQLAICHTHDRVSGVFQEVIIRKLCFIESTFSPALKASAALLEISEPNRSRVTDI